MAKPSMKTIPIEPVDEMPAPACWKFIAIHYMVQKYFTNLYDISQCSNKN